MKLARVGIRLFESDVASANLRCVAHLQQEQGAEDLSCHWLCSLHQLQLVEVAVTASVRCNLVSRLYSLTLLLRNSGLFVRMVARLRSACTSVV